MEIDKDNFKDRFDDIKKIIDECDFISLDTELTGLHLSDTKFYDTAELRYKFLKDNSMPYAVTQFGICAFKYNSVDKAVYYAPINFHVLPHAKSEKDNFNVNVSTIHFLNGVHFDFNKSWRQGVGTMRLSEFEDLNNLYSLKKENELKLVQVNDIEKFDFSSLEKLISQCNDFLFNESEQEILSTDELTKYDEYIIKEYLAKKIGCINNKWICPIVKYDKELKKKTVRILKCDNYTEAKTKLITEHYLQLENSLKEKKILSELIKHIGATRKFMIGHNCLLDAMHMFDNFISPLPEDYQAFKRVFNEHFPNFIDTKHLMYESKHAIFEKLAIKDLQGCYEATDTLTNNPQYCPWPDVDEFKDKEIFHTAHYDAFITGKLFLNLIMEMQTPATELPNNFPDFAMDTLSKYRNKFNAIFSDIKVINLDPSCVEQRNGRKHLYEATIPRHWQQHDVYSFFSYLLEKPLKFVYETFKYVWINDTSLMFKLPEEMQNMEGAMVVPDAYKDQVTLTSCGGRSNHGDNVNNAAMEADGFQMAKRVSSSTDSTGCSHDEEIDNGVSPTAATVRIRKRTHSDSL